MGKNQWGSLTKVQDTNTRVYCKVSGRHTGNSMTCSLKRFLSGPSFFLIRRKVGSLLVSHNPCSVHLQEARDNLVAGSMASFPCSNSSFIIVHLCIFKSLYIKKKKSLSLPFATKVNRGKKEIGWNSSRARTHSTTSRGKMTTA